ncbi:PREDICTED: sickle tail protein homolog [Apaloderma vittatum]|uniref:sickle tail protein homolog n=1 Tax=Apaloderma vittatum TaxID=57397 RepID=UPI00052140CE|nr:PREDICTED: sickle tail protein homolog [Apaloderma vittatum]
MEEKECQKLELCLAFSTDSRQMKDQTKPTLHVTSLDDAECLQTKERLSTPNSHTSSNSKSTRNIPRRHTVGGPRSSKEILGMQTSEMDRKREAFLEHLKQKYPHHATAIMGHQERLRDQAVGMVSVAGEFRRKRVIETASKAFWKSVENFSLLDIAEGWAGMERGDIDPKTLFLAPSALVSMSMMA